MDNSQRAYEDFFSEISFSHTSEAWISKYIRPVYNHMRETYTIH